MYSQVLQKSKPQVCFFLKTFLVYTVIFQHPSLQSESVHRPTYGALDMGGASTQITFIPRSVKDIPAGYTENLRLYGADYTVYTHSYLCYGLNEVMRRFKAELIIVS